jgi:hypothetical protein
MCEGTSGSFQNSGRDLGVAREYANDAAHLEYLSALLTAVYLIVKTGMAR